MSPVIPEKSSILVRLPNWIGDVIMSTAGLSALQQARPDLKITVLVKPWVFDVIRNHPAISDVITYGPKRGFRRLNDFRRIVSTIRERDFAAYLMFQKNFESALIGFASHIPIRIGTPTDYRGFLLTHTFVLPDPIRTGHQVRHYIALADFATGRTSSFDQNPSVFLTEEDESQARSFLQILPPGGPIIPISAGAAYGSAKCWNPEKFSEFIRRSVQSWRARVIILGDSSDAVIGRTIITNSGVEAFCVAGQYPIMVQAAIIRQAGLCIANDSGLMHLSAALKGVTSIAIFGPTKPAETSPYGQQHIILHKPVSCWPCQYRTCPLDHACMENISVEDLMTAVETVLRKK